MKTCFTLLVLSLVAVYGTSQSLNEADRLYSNYEYAAAANIYSSYRLDKELITADLERLAYCYFIVGDYKKGIPAFKDLIKRTDLKGVEHFFRLGQLQRTAEKYEDALSSFNLYKEKGGKKDVSLLIKQCKEIPTWTKTVYEKLENDAYNDEKANILISHGDLNDVSILFETGIDSAGNSLTFASNQDNFAEVLLSRPFSTTENVRIPYFWFDIENSAFSVSSVEICKAKNKVYFTVMEPTSEEEFKRAPHIYQADYVDYYTQLTNIKPWVYSGFNDNSFSAHPTLTKDGNTMVFSKTSYAKRDADLYISYFKDENWSQPIALETINTNGDEMFPVLNHDTLLTFASDGRIGYGDLDLFYTEFSYNFPSSDVQHYKAPINSAQDDFLAYWRDAYTLDFCSNRDDGKGDDDVWRMYFERPPIVNQDSVDFEEFIAKWDDPRIYFDLNKDVSDQSLAFLEDLKKFITDKPTLEIELIGHTDSQGKARYNEKLGMRRVKWLLKNFEKEGIPTDNITLISVGETELVNGCKDGIRCTEEQHAKNRFAEVKLKR